MSFDIESIPVIESAKKLGRRPNPDSTLAEAYPDHPERGGGGAGDLLSSIGVPLGMKLMETLQARAFPSGAELGAFGAGPGASAVSYTTYYDCGGYDYNGTCNEACFGFDPAHMDPFYCGTCAEQKADPSNNPAYNWHFVGSRGQIQYKDREPDVCNGKDAWKWKVGTCGTCQTSAVFRCHDGYKKLPNNNYWEPTICQGLVACDDKLTPCP